MDQKPKNIIDTEHWNELADGSVYIFHSLSFTIISSTSYNKHGPKNFTNITKAVAEYSTSLRYN